jgi:hypothetical protein
MEKSMASASKRAPARIDLEDFLEAATNAVLRALAAQEQPGEAVSLNPQPLPPGEAAREVRIGRGRIIIGIIAQPPGEI